VQSNINLKIESLGQLKEARLRFDGCTGDAEREEALKGYDRAIEEFRLLIQGNYPLGNQV
jgi:hypothetical protein